MSGPVVVLAGGVGGAKLVIGLADVLSADGLTVIGNTGDDVERHGLWISPDLDILLYTLAGVIDETKGWGYRDETFHVLQTLRALGEETWMNLGDRDLATHLFRTEARRRGERPTAIALEVGRRLGVAVPVLPPTDDDLQTRLRTPLGWLNFQEFYIREQCRPDVLEVEVAGAAEASMTPEVESALRTAALILFAPSNPIASISPILAVPGLREAIVASGARRVAISPLVGGACLKGPTLKMMRAAGFSPDLRGVAEYYRGLADELWIDPQDAGQQAALEQMGFCVRVENIVLRTREEKRRLAGLLCPWVS